MVLIQWSKRFRRIANGWLLSSMRTLSSSNIVSGSDLLSPMDKLTRVRPAIQQSTDKIDAFDGVPERETQFDEKTEYLASYKLGKRLLSLGKVHYKHIEPLPEWLKQKQSEICSHRTPAQIRRCLRQWMLQYDRNIQISFRDRKLGWRNSVDDKPVDKRVYGAEETVAYAHYFMPSRYAIAKRVFDEIKRLNPSFRAQRVLDFGCGPGTGFAAAVETFGGKARNGVEKYVAVDMSQAMLDAAKIMSRDMDVDAVFWNKASDVVQAAKTRGDRFDLILCMYTLTELQSDPARKAAVQLLFELLDVGGQIVFLEQGNPQGSHTVRSARQFLLNVFSDSQGPQESDEKRKKAASSKRGHNNSESPPFDPEQAVTSYALPPPDDRYSCSDLFASVISPCTHDKKCPLGPGIWCSFSQKVHSGMIRIDSEEKFSYVVLQRRPRASTSIKNVLNEYEQKRKFWPKHDDSSDKNGSSKMLHDVDRKELSQLGTWLAAIDGVESPPPRETDPSPLAVLKRFMEVRREIEEGGEEREEDEDDDVRGMDFEEGEEEGDEDEDDLNLEELELNDETVEEMLDDEAIPMLKGKSKIQKLVDKLDDEIDWEAYNPKLIRAEWARVLRSPIKGKGHVALDLCHPSGSVCRHILSKSSVDHVPALYTALRKTTWGGLFPAFPHDPPSQSPEDLLLPFVQDEPSPLLGKPKQFQKVTAFLRPAQRMTDKPQEESRTVDSSLNDSKRVNRTTSVPGTILESPFSKPTSTVVKKLDERQRNAQIEQEQQQQKLKQQNSNLSKSGQGKPEKKRFIPNKYELMEAPSNVSHRRPSSPSRALERQGAIVDNFRKENAEEDSTGRTIRSGGRLGRARPSRTRL